MENKDKIVEDWNNDNVVNELIQGRELARQLQVQLNMPSSSSSYEIQNFLAQNILVSYEKALSLLMLNWTNSPLPKTTTPYLSIPIMSETPPSSANPMNKYQHDHESQNHNLIIKSSNANTRWSKQVRMTPGIGLEETLDDGFDWRKYGQKHIIGSKFLRGYYKCSMRNVEDCLATKQVQRLDIDPNIFQVVYRGIHTCSQASSNYKSMNIPINPKEINHKQDMSSTQHVQSFSSFNLASTEENDGLLGCITNNTNSVYDVGGFSETSAGFEQMNNSQESQMTSMASSSSATTSSTFPFSHTYPPNFTSSNPNAFFYRFHHN